uniref:Uncharacterized protein n=1 Tax=Arundo donax TaxID=35708 RepID=A0A0A9D5E0_ARUDO
MCRTMDSISSYQLMPTSSRNSGCNMNLSKCNFLAS